MVYNNLSMNILQQVISAIYVHHHSSVPVQVVEMWIWNFYMQTL